MDCRRGCFLGKHKILQPESRKAFFFIWFIFLQIIAFLLKYPLWIVAGAASSENMRFRKKESRMAFFFICFVFLQNTAFFAKISLWIAAWRFVTLCFKGVVLCMLHILIYFSLVYSSQLSFPCFFTGIKIKTTR